MPRHTCDVVVVGAGLAGLRAAERLAAKGIDVQVLEARDRVGGKTWTVDSHGTSIDVGGQWIGPTQQRALALIDELGLALFESSLDAPLDTSGDFTVVLDGDLYSLPRLDEEHLRSLPIAPTALEQLHEAHDELERLAATVPADKPWMAPWARRWDIMTFEHWMNEWMSDPMARALFTALDLNELAVAPVDISVLAYLHQVATSPAAEKPDTWRIVGGAQQISERLADRLGDRVHLGDPVVSIEWTDDGAIVYTDLDQEYVARRVIVALPPHLAGRIHYYPPVPVARDCLTARYPVGHVIKAQAVYDRPFWRDQGKNGYAFIPVPQTITLIVDNSTPESERGVLAGFVYADRAAELSDEPAESRRARVLRDFAAVFGPQAMEPLYYVEGLWSREQWSLGAWQCIPSAGAWTSYGEAWRAPIGPLHWAAADYADRWYGYIDGAISSGEGAAASVAASLV